jgi:predicted ATPase/DNA-binding winged helix-turn-helix (wHTH) protein
VELGARALDILICLLSRPNEVFSKKDLIGSAWPDVVVEEGSLRFQIAGLRKALGDQVGDARYIATLAGRGYCFVAPVFRPADEPGDEVAAAPASKTNLPNRPSRLIGRASDISGVMAEVLASRLVTIVGSGGVGKTTVAIAVAHDMPQAAIGSILFFDLGLVSEPRRVATSLTAMLGVSVVSENPVPALIAFLRDKRMLLILDTCEHVIDDVAALAEEILHGAPLVRILATSREALRVEEEQVYRLAPLAIAPAVPDLTAAIAVTYPAVQLFVERVAANGTRLDLADADAPMVARICERLDGVALAIELAAGRVAAYGLGQVAALLDERLSLSWPGHRTAPGRQRTLHATIDWSYRLLPETEQAVLRRLSVFVGPFTLEAAQHVAS